MLRLDTVLTVAKSLTAKVMKDDSGVLATVAQMKFSDLAIDRDAIDELLGEPIGWCSTTLYDEQGAPRKRYGLTVYGRQLRVSGTVSGTKAQTLALLQAELSDVHLTLIPLGAMVEGKLTWSARGTEVEDVSELLGKECAAKWEITDGDQADLFNPTSRAASAATTETARIIGGLGKDRPSA